jgi:hypothetical protein
VPSLIKPDGAWGALLTEFAGSYNLVMSDELASEIRRVFAQSSILRRLAVSAPGPQSSSIDSSTVRSG